MLPTLALCGRAELVASALLVRCERIRALQAVSTGLRVRENARTGPSPNKRRHTAKEIGTRGRAPNRHISIGRDTIPERVQQLLNKQLILSQPC